VAKRKNSKAKMLSESFKYVEHDVEKWLRRYKLWYNKILETEKELKSVIKINVSQSTFGDLITFWIYTCIGGIPDEERKVLGKWIMKLIDKEEAPTLFKTNDTNYDAYRFFNQFTDDDGQYDVNINLVL